MNSLGCLRRTLPTIILLGALIAVLIAPVCGWLFNCGCDWPWHGFIEHCNAFIAESPDKCPWCVNSFIDTITSEKPNNQNQPY
jgi:hypothetical protein